MPGRIRKICAGLRRNDHLRRLVKYLITGGGSTILGLAVVHIEVRHLDIERNLANFLQALLLFGAFFPLYYRWVYKRGSSKQGRAFRRWLATKLFTLFGLGPLTFFLLSLYGLSLTQSNLGASAACGGFSFVVGYWAFGSRLPKWSALFRKG